MDDLKSAIGLIREPKHLCFSNFELIEGKGNMNEMNETEIRYEWNCNLNE